MIKGEGKFMNLYANKCMKWKISNWDCEYN